jgi:hypothetical protein
MEKRGINGKNPAAVELGRRGGQARAKVLTSKERKAIAAKASKAAAKARSKKAADRKKTQS